MVWNIESTQETQEHFGKYENTDKALALFNQTLRVDLIYDQIRIAFI